MAFLRDIKEGCYEPGCRARAVVELVNRYNAPSGKFCRKHSKRALAKMLKSEAEANLVKTRWMLTGGKS